MAHKTRRPGEHEPNKARIAGPQDAGSLPPGFQFDIKVDPKDVVLVGKKPQEMADSATGFMGLWKGKWYVSSAGTTHAESGMAVLRRLRDVGAKPPDHWELLEETARFNVGFDGPDRVFYLERPKDNYKFKTAAEVLKALGVGEESIRHDPKILSAREA
ncbi:MAG: hypothetical protein PHG85_01035 [Candidatus Altiarchaeota archaeon]|nr:hypothetical protein [Candidatus Altiarchaeota archaeon]